MKQGKRKQIKHEWCWSEQGPMDFTTGQGYSHILDTVKDAQEKDKKEERSDMVSQKSNHLQTPQISFTCMETGYDWEREQSHGRMDCAVDSYSLRQASENGADKGNRCQDPVKVHRAMDLILKSRSLDK
ncbi:uncharacterized protein MEPE_04861 [Melanopsichium pennsylvanicum]|uniref:Uncharacterized protein n=1 Tax=Melanopsichium pennsylvanicum TaxID=63383 RepID=A0AAJ4XPR4_9BASI|nr:uncharacterized protein MEPE_04861 [Melanopsichium pennsylvanicum]